MGGGTVNPLPTPPSSTSGVAGDLDSGWFAMQL